ncbi:hypothetical protein [Chitinophaga sp. MM2321]|uniref:hypothetical protein n=1 Tax=Chitinophaga sp. MM2321 TaxID=3137178 RepID=UPI0032D59A76
MPPIIQLDKLYYINVGEHGTFQPSGEAAYDSTYEHIDDIFKYLEAQDQKKLVLYFHGGLVGEDSGMDTAQRITKYVKDNTTSHPVCFVWETGLLETVRQNFDVIGDSPFFKKLLIKVVKIAGKMLGIEVADFIGASKGVGNLTEEEINAELSKEEPFKDYKVDPGKKSVNLVAVENMQDEEVIKLAIASEVEAEVEEEVYSDVAFQNLALQPKPPEEERLMKGEHPAIEDATGKKGIILPARLIISATKITIAVIRRHVTKRNHGFYPTIIEEILREFYVADIGTWAWGRMRDKARDMWNEDDFSGDPLDWHAGTYLLKKIVEYKKDHPDLIIDLVGHSAGSIAICELIKAVNERNIDLAFRNILFMAPACRCELFAETILKGPARFKNFRCFTMSDVYEIKDHLVPVLYPRSLLYLISGILEERQNDAFILGLQRHITGGKPYDKEPVLQSIMNFIKGDGRISYSVTGDDSTDGFRSTALHHGDFDNDKEATLDSLMYLIKQ